VVRQSDAVRAILKLMQEAPVQTLADQLLVRVLHRHAEVLPARVRDSDFDFYGRVVGGLAAPEPRWRRAVAFVLAAVPDEVSRQYVAAHFSPATKAAAETMVRDLIAAFGRRIDRLDWMTPETRARAHGKLAAFHAYVGYPERWHDYDGLLQRQGDAFGNAVRAAEFHQAWEAAKVGKPIYTFAHEMSHHFDDQGSRFDEHGRLTSWWSSADRAAFEQRAAVLVKQFDRYEPLPDMHVNGSLTLGENIADLGGLAIAYEAYRDSLGGREAPLIDGLSGDQRFFLGWAQIWRLKYRDADLRRRLLSNSHAPAAKRVWTVRNLQGWIEAFEVRDGDTLHLPDGERAAIW
jgi:putative endopeptidase